MLSGSQDHGNRRVPPLAGLGSLASLQSKFSSPLQPASDGLPPTLLLARPGTRSEAARRLSERTASVTTLVAAGAAARTASVAGVVLPLAAAVGWSLAFATIRAITLVLDWLVGPAPALPVPACSASTTSTTSQFEGSPSARRGQVRLQAALADLTLENMRLRSQLAGTPVNGLRPAGPEWAGNEGGEWLTARSMGSTAPPTHRIYDLATQDSDLDLDDEEFFPMFP